MKLFNLKFKANHLNRKLGLAALVLVFTGSARGEEPRAFLEGLRRHSMRTPTIADNGDTNPYAVVVAPVSAGLIHEGDVLIDNFNNLSNLQGTGTTIVDFNPTTKKTDDFRKAASPAAQNAPVGSG